MNTITIRVLTLTAAGMLLAQSSLQASTYNGNDAMNIVIYLAETKNNQKYGKLIRVDKDNLVELACDSNIDSGLARSLFERVPQGIYPISGRSLWTHFLGPWIRLPEYAIR